MQQEVFICLAFRAQGKALLHSPDKELEADWFPSLITSGQRQSGPQVGQIRTGHLGGFASSSSGEEESLKGPVPQIKTRGIRAGNFPAGRFRKPGSGWMVLIRFC